MKWKVRDSRRVYTSEWVDVWVEQIEAGDDTFEHHVLRMPKRTVSTVVIDSGQVLLIWRHRFITNTWGWEIPAGWVEPGEELADAARREVKEETGWTARSIEPLVSYNALSGISSLQMNTFLGSDVVDAGPVKDKIESSRVEWTPLARIPELAANGEIVDGPSLTGLTYYLSARQGETSGLPAAKRHPASPAPDSALSTRPTRKSRGGEKLR